MKDRLTNTMGAPRAGMGGSGGGRSGKMGKQSAKAAKEYNQRVKKVVKDPSARANDPSVLRAVTKRGGTKPYSKMTAGTMQKAPKKPSTAGRKYKAPGKK